jgi:hypothetical protein
MGKGLFSWLHINTPSLPKLSNDTSAGDTSWWNQPPAWLKRSALIAVKGSCLLAHEEKRAT